jgi:hypothetical protein
MKDDKRSAAAQAGPNGTGSLPNRILGSLRDALNAASRDDRSGEITLGEKSHTFATGAAPDGRKQAGPQTVVSARAPEAPPAPPPAQPAPPVGSAAHALREAKSPEPKHFEPSEPSTQSLRASAPAGVRQAAAAGGDAKTQALESAHSHRLRRRHHLLGGAGLHPLRFDGPLVPVCSQSIQDQYCRSQ